MAIRFAVRLLGPPQLELDGEPVVVERRKAVALLAYLTVTGQRSRRDVLVNLLWPEADAARGKAALRRTLYALRRAMGGAGEWLEASRDEIALETRGGLWVDIVAFREHVAECEHLAASDRKESQMQSAAQVCAACAASLAKGVDLHRGDFLSGFSLKDSVNFDDWQAFQAERLRQELAWALERLVGWHTAQRAFEPALGYARRRLALDTLDEAAHRDVMRLHAWSGRRTAALRQYEKCAALLADQLGVPPHKETGALYEAIQAGEVPPLRSAKASPLSEVKVPRPSSLVPEADEPHAPSGTPPVFLAEDAPAERPLFVAREQELARLQDYLDAALTGRGRLAFVTGDAGRGKSALLQEFSYRVQAAHPDLVVASGICNAQTGIGDPYLPFREILELLTGDVEARWAAGAVSTEHARRLWGTLPLTAQTLVEVGPDLVDTFVTGGPLLRRAAAVCGAGEAPWLGRLAAEVDLSRQAGARVSAAQEQSHLFDQYVRVLQAVAREVPLVLFVDDLQWADVGSISLLFHLGRQMAGNRILLLGAYRPEEVALGRLDPTSGAGGRQRHPLEPVVHEFQRDYGDITVRLGGDEGQDFVETLLDSEPNQLGGTFREMLHRRTLGHPLFTLELLRGLQERGDVLQDEQGRWVQGPSLDLDTLPARVEAVIAERIGRLAAPLRETLRIASVEGEVFTAEVVAQIRGVPPAGLVGTLSGDLDRVHRLVRAEDIQRLDGRRLSRYRFRHTLYQRYLYHSLDPVERAYLHEALGTALESLYADEEGAVEPIAGQLALHFQEAGLPARAVLYLQQAGERALRLSAYQESLNHLTRGLDLLRDLPDSRQRGEQELALQLTMGLARVVPKGYGPKAKAAYDRAQDLSRQLGELTQLSRVLGELAVYHYVRAEHHTSKRLATEALDLAQQLNDPLLQTVERTYLGFVSFALGEYTDALDHLEQVIAFYQPEQHHRALVSLRGSDMGIAALAYTACSLWSLGYPDQAVERSRQALGLAHELGHPATLADALCYAGCVFNVMQRDAAALTEHTVELLNLATRKLRGWLGAATWYSGEALVLSNDLEKGMERMQKGLEIQFASPERCYRTGALGSLASALGQAGRSEEGLRALARGLAQVEETGERYAEAELYRIQGALRLQQGNEAAAEASLLRAVEVARRQQASSWELRATTDLARLWQSQDRVDDAFAVLSEVYEWFSEGFDTADLQAAKALLLQLSAA